MLLNLTFMWDFFSQRSTLALQCVDGSCAQGCCSCSAQHSGCCVALMWDTAVLGTSCSLLQAAGLCLLQSQAMPLFALPARFSAGWGCGNGGSVRGAVRGGTMPSAAPRNQPPAGATGLHQAATAPAKVTLGWALATHHGHKVLLQGTFSFWQGEMSCTYF